jgi:hypothetical protein
MAKANTRARCYSGTMQRVQCTTVTRKHPHFSQSLQSWYGWVGRCCIARESRTDGLPKAKWHFEAKAKTLSSMANVLRCKGKKALRRQKQSLFESKDKCLSKARTVHRQQLTKIKVVRRQSVQCTIVRSKHPHFSQSLKSWPWCGWVGGFCITTESRT